ncbi:NUDIX domain-containing protein [Azospirillum sp. SYSU D00513]|uniref:NUDIX hydrolase n=1 Tax=Azospirillum sp. SYSU D00513 TaxID=2812561 RepID=UPI001A9698F5|nr:NUDIX domain-containing protein [Azospirillum sp. SYSU D00513]
MTPPAEPRPSASLILLRDGADGLELLMIRRHAGLRFAPGAMVFPGGGLEEQDHDPDWRDHCRLHPDDAAHRVAAIRETFEECGLLLAGSMGTDGLAGEEQRAAFLPNTGETLLDALRRSGLELATDRLVPFAHWVTPEILRRRFDTLFYLAPAPAGQELRIDAGEAVDALWATPRAILARADAGELKLIFVTRMILRRLAGCADMGAAVLAARERPLVPVMPVRVETPAGPVFRIRADAGYSPTEFPEAEVTLG